MGKQEERYRKNCSRENSRECQKRWRSPGKYEKCNNVRER